MNADKTKIGKGVGPGTKAISKILSPKWRQSPRTPSHYPSDGERVAKSRMSGLRIIHPPQRYLNRSNE
jgi:hypothetical protein